ncbi:hypothetical protein ACFWIA_27950 [Streptomyces sp. NPDC127068]|uniref:DinB/UmuC family translesion DNA polymerase n=1 Tax=Streptomyces sp. NPDC127068 TaxID=3347127 RepID=UPI003651D2B8
MDPNRSLGARHDFARDELDSERHQRVVLGLAEELGARFRAHGEIAQAVTLTVSYADRTHTTRARALPSGPTAHAPLLARTARDLLHDLGLQRARVRALAVRAERLLPAERLVRQLALDGADDRAHHLEAALDRARCGGRGVRVPALPVLDVSLGRGNVAQTGRRSPGRRPLLRDRAGPRRGPTGVPRGLSGVSSTSRLGSWSGALWRRFG